MQLDRSFLFTVFIGILSKCLILTFGNISIQNLDSSISKKTKLWQNIKFKLIDKIWKKKITQPYIIVIRIGRKLN